MSAGRSMNRGLGQGPEAILEGRLRILTALIVLVFGAFGVRLFQLQIIEGEVLQARSEQNSIRIVRLEAPRGRIVDRDGRVIATTRTAFGLQVLPADLRDPERAYAALAQLLDAERAWFRERVGSRSRGSGRFRPVRLLDDLSFDQLARVETHRYALPGVTTDVRPRRHYLEGELGAHLLGTIGEIRSDQLEKPTFAEYRSGDVIGQSGLERRLEPHLRGRAGGRTVVVDVAGREVELLEELAPEPGGTAVLAIDLDLQREAERALREGGATGPPRAGAVVALDVHSGDVLAMTSLPTYDPNHFAGGIDIETWEGLTSDEWKPLQNRAIQNHYPPGSTYKAMVAAALLEDGVITPETRVFCPGYFRYGRRSYRCWKRAGHGWVDLRKALKRSCDVFFYQHGVTLGIDRLAHFAKSFSLGQRTGIDLPHEATGLVPSSKWKERRFGEVWYPGETVSASIGQGYNLATPLQMAVAFAAVANGGLVMKPRVLLRLESREGEVTERVDPVVRGRVPVSSAHLATVRQGLTAVVEEQGGTGRRARVPGVRVAGKTGTAQVVRLERVEGLEDDEIPIRHRDHAWFVAFAPADEPELAVSVFVEHGQHGSSGAGPIAQRVLARWFEKRNAIESGPQPTDRPAPEPAPEERPDDPLPAVAVVAPAVEDSRALD